MSSSITIFRIRTYSTRLRVAIWVVACRTGLRSLPRYHAKIPDRTVSLLCCFVKTVFSRLAYFAGGLRSEVLISARRTFNRHQSRIRTVMSSLACNTWTPFWISSKCTDIGAIHSWEVISTESITCEWEGGAWTSISCASCWSVVRK